MSDFGKGGGVNGYAANRHSLAFLNPTQTLPRWEREHKESADYAYIKTETNWAHRGLS